MGFWGLHAESVIGVSLFALRLWGFLAVGTQRALSTDMFFSGPQILIHLDTILILVYIHTYPGFARRININVAQLMRATLYRALQACTWHVWYQSGSVRIWKTNPKLSCIAPEKLWNRFLTCKEHHYKTNEKPCDLVLVKKCEFPFKNQTFCFNKIATHIFLNLARNRWRLY